MEKNDKVLTIPINATKSVVKRSLTSMFDTTSQEQFVKDFEIIKKTAINYKKIVS